MTAGSRDCPQWRIDRWHRIDLVNRYVSSLDDRRMLLMAFLMMRGLDRKHIMETLKMDDEEYAITKDRLAFGLLFAGIAVRDCTSPHYDTSDTPRAGRRTATAARGTRTPASTCQSAAGSRGLPRRSCPTW